MHGGCWLSVYADLRNADALADALRDEGIATWNAEYRCVDQEGGGWPGTFLDAGRATDHLRMLAADHDLDPGPRDRHRTLGGRSPGAVDGRATQAAAEQSPLDCGPAAATRVGGPGRPGRFKKVHAPCGRRMPAGDRRGTTRFAWRIARHGGGPIRLRIARLGRGPVQVRIARRTAAPRPAPGHDQRGTRLGRAARTGRGLH